MEANDHLCFERTAGCKERRKGNMTGMCGKSDRRGILNEKWTNV